MYNGRAVIRSFVVESITLEVDACLVGGGGICKGIGYFFYPFTETIVAKNLHISALESLNTLVALRVLGHDLKGKTVRLFCDNMPTVLALQTGKAKDSFMAFVLRQSWLLCAQFDIQLHVSHKPGVDLITADLLSRGFKTQKDWVKLCKFRSSTVETWIEVEPVICLSLMTDLDEMKLTLQVRFLIIPFRSVTLRLIFLTIFSRP